MVFLSEITEVSCVWCGGRVGGVKFPIGKDSTPVIILDVDNKKRKELKVRKYSDVVGKADGRKKRGFCSKIS